jgi:hypothetical protein
MREYHLLIMREGGALLSFVIVLIVQRKSTQLVYESALPIASASASTALIVFW